MRIELKNSQGRMMNREFERYIAEKLSLYQDCIVKDAMIYCMDGGKRFRPRIIFAIAKGFGLSEEQAYPLGLALEMIQSYSLIHDDLPAMDNDDFRRGKPSCHKAFGEDIAIWTGDALLTESLNFIADSGLEPRIIDKCIPAHATANIIPVSVFQITADMQIRYPPADVFQLSLFFLRTNAAYNRRIIGNTIL